MAKKKSSKKKESAVRSSTTKPALVAQISAWIQQHYIFSAFLFYLAIAIAFFYGVVLQGKIYFVPDSQAPAALNAPLWQMLNNEGIHAFWSPYIFGGMPTYGSLIFTPFVYFPYLAFTLINLNANVLAILHFPLAGLGVYLILRDQKVEYLPAFLGGLAFMLTPHLISMETFGHGSKLMTAAWMPLALWAMMRLFEKRGLRHLGLAALILGFQFQRGHVQIVYYTWLLLGLFLVFSIVQKFREGQGAKFYQPLLQFLIVLILALGMAAVLYLPVLEYMPHSIRGAVSVFAQSTRDSGVGMEYATQWSFSPGEMMTFLIPSFYGFGGQTYWGTMPFTDYPHYMGIVIFGLALFSIIYRKKQWLVWFFVLEIVLALLISFGKNSLSIYGLFYDFFPYFNKFRVPVMILILVQLGFAVLAGLGLQSLLEIIRNQRKSENKLASNILYAAAGLIALLVLLSLGKGLLQGMLESLYPARYAPATQAQINQMRFDLFFKDMWVVGLFASAALIAIYAALTQKIKAGVLAFGFCLITFFDLWMVIGKINNPVSGGQMRSYLQQDQVGQFLQQDKSTFRIFPLNVGFARLSLFNENRWAAQGIQSIGGYFAAKLQTYQDFLDGTRFYTTYLDKYYKVQNVGGQNKLVPARPLQSVITAQNNLLSFLNVKYLISPYPVPDSSMTNRAQVGINFHGQTLPLLVVENKSVRRRAFFIDNFRLFDDAKKLLSALGTGELDPTQSVGLYQEPSQMPLPDSTAVVKSIKYHPHHIEIETHSAKPQLLVLSDPWYPAGWQATINGEAAEILQANHAFRALAVPDGDNLIEFKLTTPAYNKGKWISLLSFLVVVGLLVGGGLRQASESD